MSAPSIALPSGPARHFSRIIASRRGVILLSSIFILVFASVSALAFLTPAHAQEHIALANANTAVTTYKGDVARDGDYPNETTLNTSNVNPTQFGKRISYPVDGQVYAQPLFVPNVTIGGVAHNVVFAATQHDSVYAFDADAFGGAAPLWQRSFLGTNVTTVPSSDVYGRYPNHDIDPEVGITGTPVIDPASNTLYVSVATKENGSYFQRLHAIDITTGNDRAGSPATITASVRGTGADSVNGTVPFNAKTQNQRDALMLFNGVVYISWASYGDTDPYHGWIIGYNATTLAQTAVNNNTPNGIEGGIWESGEGLAATAGSTTMYYASGNGTYDLNSGGSDGGNTVFKLNTALQTQEYFTPFNQSCLNPGDTDLGSGGVVVLPIQNGTAHPKLILAGGKEGRLYVIDRNPGAMGGYITTSNPCSNQNLTNVDKVVQELPAGTVGGLWTTPAYWNGPSAQYVYYEGSGDHIKAFTLSNDHLSTTPSSQTPESFTFPNSNAVISSNGNAAGTGILWAITPTGTLGPGGQSASPGVLRAYDATNLGTELYNSSQNATRDALEGYAKFSVATVGNGRVYVGTSSDANSVGKGTLDVYGELSSNVSTSGYYKILNRNSGLLMDVTGQSTANGALVDQYTDHSGTNQEWQLVAVGSGFYKIVNRNSGKVLEVPTTSASNPKQLDQNADNGAAYQQWQLPDTGGGYYDILNRDSGQVADVFQALKTAGVAINQWPANGGTNQQWQLVPTT